MAMVKLTPGCTKNTSQALSFENNNELRDASFSSYLKFSEGTSVPKPAELSQNPNSIITIQHEHLSLGRKKVEDGEIGVFGAEKYFNGGMDEENPRIASKGAINHQQVKDEPVDTGPVKPRIQVGTPSIRSESSWNSQSALLQSVLRNPPQRKTNRTQGKSLLASLACNCSCNDKDSVDIDEHVGESNSKRSVTKEPNLDFLDPVDLARTNKSRLNPWVMEEMQCKKIDEVGLGLKREDCFSFPILNSKPGNLAVKVNLQGQEDEKQRKSLEVFGSPALQKKKKSLGPERRLTMLTWDTNARMEELEIRTSSDGIYEDIESDASSDLFEIESFTNNSNPFLLRQASDGMSSCVTPTTCYAPSEASIEWSVVTASAADFSAVSDSDDPISSATATTKARKMAPNAKAAAGKEMEKRNSGMLLGCKSDKAVRIAGDAYITNGKPVPDPRFQANKSKLTGFDSTKGRHGFDARSLSRSHSARASHLLYIQ